MSNKHLDRAKKTVNDEFYTRLEDIEHVMPTFEQYFKGKVVYCPCDNPSKSMFWKYFTAHFRRLGLKKVVATCIDNDTKTVFDGNKTIRYQMESVGDFTSFDCVNIMRDVDIVVTNPPFSAGKPQALVELCLKYNKRLLLLIPLHCISHKAMFPNFVKEKVCLTDIRVSKFILDTGAIKKINNVYWCTNLPYERAEEILLMPYVPKYYDFYDNLPDVLNVDRINDIPDFNGTMGVPLTYLAKHNPKQFKLVGTLNDCGAGGFSLGAGYIHGKKKFTRVLIRKVNHGTV